MEEIFKPIVGYEGLYEISNLGRVKGLVKMNRCGNQHGAKSFKPIRERIMKEWLLNRGSGYKAVTLVKEGVKKNLLVHRLVALTFIYNSENKLTINHIDGNSKNNHVSNLEWCTQKENVDHARLILKRGSISGQGSKLTPRSVIEIKRWYATQKISQGKLGAYYGAKDNVIYGIVNNITWKNVENTI